MRTVWTLFAGIIGGFVLAHFVNQTEKGSAFFEGVNDTVREIKEAVVEGYNEA